MGIRLSQYPKVIYLSVMIRKNPPMERTEHWRQRLLELKADLDLSQASIAAKIDLPPSYVSRLLYPPGKPGRKNLGLDTMRSLREAYGLSADWFDLPLGEALPSKAPTQSSTSLSVAEPPPFSNVVHVQTPSWPFKLVPYSRILALKSALGPRLAAEAMRDLDERLNFEISIWEAKNNKTKKPG